MSPKKIKKKVENFEIHAIQFNPLRNSFFLINFQRRSDPNK